MNNYTKGTTFYRGEGDGLIYASKEAAQKSQLSPNQKLIPIRTENVHTVRCGTVRLLQLMENRL